MSYSEFTIILPTLNEAGNIKNLIEEINNYYKDIFIIVSDDGSIDDTKDVILSFQNRRIFFLDRKHRKIHGLTASVLDASEIVNTKYFIVMDADNQHPWETVKEIVDGLKKGSKLVTASRKKVEGYWSISRKSASYLGNFLGKLSLLIRGKMYLGYDILTGFFGAETTFWKEIVFDKNKRANFRPKGYKVLFDFLKIVPNKVSVKNVHYIFGARKKGSSKINISVYIEFMKAVFL